MSMIFEEDEVVDLISKEGDRWKVHAWLLRNASRVFKDLLAVIEDKEIQLAETNYEVKLLLNALYGPSIVLPEGLQLEGEALSWRTVCMLAELADKFHAPRLLRSCTDFMVSKAVCLEAVSSNQGLSVALEWLRLAKRLELHDVTTAVASLLGRMFFDWDVKAHLQEVSSEMDPASFLRVVSNISVGTSKAAQGALDSSAPPSREEVSRPEEQQAPVQGHFAGTAEPLLGYPHFQGHHALTAQALIPVGHW